MIAWGNGLPGLPASVAGGGLVPRLPGLVHHYRTPTLAGWADRVGGVDGVHTGSPALASGGPPLAPTGVEYDGTTQYTTIGSQASLAFIHQTWTFSVAGSIVPDLSSTCRIWGNAISGTNRGIYLLASTAGALTLAIFNGSTSTTCVSSAGALANATRQHLMVGGDGSRVWIAVDGAEVAQQTTLIAVGAGNATHGFGLGTLQSGLLPGGASDLFDVAIGNEDWSEFAGDLAAEAA